MLNGPIIMDQRLLSVVLAVYIRIGCVKGPQGHRDAHVVDLFCGVLPRHRHVEIPATTPVRPQRGLAGACSQLTSSLAIISIARYNPESRLNQDSFTSTYYRDPTGWWVNYSAPSHLGTVIAICSTVLLGFYAGVTTIGPLGH